MKIELVDIPIGSIVAGFSDKGEEGVYGMNGQLNIRPKYQREFIYKNKKKEAVIDTVNRGLPLNSMYFLKQKDGRYEVLDGQQRIMSICSYVENKFSVKFRFFNNLEDSEKQTLLNYNLMVYLCTSDNDSDTLAWFKTINIAGEKLTDQELRNAVYAGPWLSAAKHYFSKTKCPAYEIGGEYMRGSPIRQDYLQTVIKWISNNHIEEYMAQHQNATNANELWLYFQSVVAWVSAIFPNYRREMRGVEWGYLYNEFGRNNYDPAILEKSVQYLMMDDDVTHRSGIYEFVLSGRERALNIRAFTPNQKREAYERQNGVCPACGKQFKIEDMEADHITPWSAGGKTVAANCQMLCRDCNRLKGSI